MSISSTQKWSVARFPLDKRNLSKLNDINATHKAVLALFPSIEGGNMREHYEITFRASQGVYEGRPVGVILISANAFPELPSETSSAGFSDVFVENLPHELPEFSIGTSLSLNIKLAAEHRGRDSESKKIHTRPVTNDDFEDWSVELLKRNGFTIKQIVAGGDSYSWDSETNFSTRKGATESSARSGRSFHYREVVLVGEVSDASLFNEAVRKGIGRGKAFGFGLVLPSAIA